MIRWLIFFLLISGVALGSTQFQVRVAATNDDAYIDIHQSTPFDSTIYLNDVTFYLGCYNTSFWQNGYFRFLSATISGTIDSAWLLYTCIGTTSTTGQQYRYFGEDTSSATIFSTVADAKVRNLTSASVDTTVSGWTSGNTYRSPDIKSVIQEIVNRGDWASGNNIVVIVKALGATAANGHRAESYENAGTTPTQLNVWYTPSGGGGGTDTSRVQIHAPGGIKAQHSPTGIGATHKP